MEELEKTLTKYFVDKAPKIPEDLQSLIVTYGPFIILIFVVISGLNLVMSLGFNTVFFNPLRSFAGPVLGVMYNVYLIFTAVILLLQALALPGLFNKTLRGWRYLFYSVLVGAVSQIITFNIFGLIIGAGIGLYVLFQIKHHYK